MERHYFGLSTLLASVALLIWSIGETFAFPQGPHVSMGSNPILSFDCATNTSYTVPSNSTFIVTDMSAYFNSYNSQLQLKADGVTRWSMRGSNHESEHFTSGVRFDSNEVINCSGFGYVSGYLAHQ